MYQQQLKKLSVYLHLVDELVKDSGIQTITFHLLAFRIDRTREILPNFTGADSWLLFERRNDFIVQSFLVQFVVTVDFIINNQISLHKTKRIFKLFINTTASIIVFLCILLTPQLSSPFQKSQFFVCINSNFVTRFLPIDLTLIQSVVYQFSNVLNKNCFRFKKNY